MPTTNLSKQDILFKAQALKQKMELESDLKNFGIILDEFLQLPAPTHLKPTDKAELAKVADAIRAGTASNNMKAMVLDRLSIVLD